jgi:hypothetical protein
VTTINSAINLDSYVLRARVVPATLAGAPLVFFMAFIAGSPLIGALVPTAGVLGIFIVAAEWVRMRGRNTEVRLKMLWDGFPTTRALRFRDLEFAAERDERRKAIESLTGTRLPKLADERKSPDRTDQIYARAIGTAAALIRGEAQYADLLQAENISYGLRRNVRALKTLGLTLAVVAFPVSIIVSILTSAWVPALVVCIGLAILIAFWTIVVRDDWVQHQANDYADRLFTSAIASAASTKRKK